MPAQGYAEMNAEKIQEWLVIASKSGGLEDTPANDTNTEMHDYEMPVRILAMWHLAYQHCSVWIKRL